jgi:hypothetical protein
MKYITTKLIKKMQDRKVLWFGPDGDWKIPVIGKIVIENNIIFICQDRTLGAECNEDRKKPYKYSYAFYDNLFLTTESDVLLHTNSKNFKKQKFQI